MQTCSEISYFSRNIDVINKKPFKIPERSLVKPYEKLYILDGELTVDNRRSYSRYFSDDSRNKTLEYLLKSDKNLLYTVNTLIDTTYKKDNVWIAKARKIIIENGWGSPDISKFDIPNYSQTWADILCDFSIDL